MFAIRAHKDAPLYSSWPGTGLEGLPSRLALWASSSSASNPSDSEGLLGEFGEAIKLNPAEAIDVFRQTCLVSLHFFLKYVASYAGPYNLTNDELHLDMCNFRQSDACMSDGARAAAFIPRGHSKSTFFTHGADTWEIIRNPYIRICIVNNIRGKAQEFMRIIRENFEHNEFLRLLFPEFCPENPRTQPRWNEEELVCPARDRIMQAPTVGILGVGGAAEGGHFDLLNIDDPDGLDSIDQNHSSNANMETTKKWFYTNRSALIDSWKTSRIIFVGTRYALDDTASIITNDAHKVYGCQDSGIEEKPTGAWAVYYRRAIEDGVIIYPEKFTQKDYDDMASNPETHWTWVTQYLNDPRQAGLAELYDQEIKECQLRYDSEEQEYKIVFAGDAAKFNEKDIETVYLRECDIVMTVDPAATDKGISAKTSRTSIGVSAKDYRGRVFRIWSKVGFFRIDTVMNYIFLGHKVFGGLIRATYFENNAFQKVLKPLLEIEEADRGEYVNPQGRPALQDKVIRIRATLSNYLTAGKLYATVEAGKELREELRVFPMASRMDVLDEQEKACSYSIRPESPEERETRLGRQEIVDAGVELDEFGYRGLYE